MENQDLTENYITKFQWKSKKTIYKLFELKYNYKKLKLYKYFLLSEYFPTKL